MKEVFMEKIAEEILKEIQKEKKITIFGHVFPDGDCYGSQLGMKYALEENFKGKKIYALGTGFTKMIPLLGEMDVVSDEIIENSLAIVLDSSTKERVEDQRFLKAKKIIHVDHHTKTSEFADLSYVNEQMVSTTEILISLFQMWGFTLTKKIATPLMLGLITDSGRFLYSLRKENFLHAAYLMNFDVDVSRIYDSLYETSEANLKLKGYYYSSYKKANNVLYTIFTKKDLKKLEKTAHEAVINVNLLSSIQGYPIWASFAENDDGTVKAEFRCKKEFEVAEIAISYGGGGHPCASGCTLKSLQEIPQVIKQLEKLANHEKFYDEVLKDMIKASKIARKKILEVYATDFNVEIKEDQSPVTLADKGADQLIREYLHKKYPNYAFLTEESIDDKKRLENAYCFIVDPVDGTQDFVAKNGEFTTNIALCFQHEIVAGVVSIPVSGDIYYASRGNGVYHLFQDGKLTPIHVSDKLTDLTLYVSRFHATEHEKKQLENFPQITKMEAHGSSLKACFIAEGKGELHYRLSAGTKEWDTAAIQIIVEEAGGYFLKPDGTRYRYNREDVYNWEGYIIVNRKENILIK